MVHCPIGLHLMKHKFKDEIIKNFKGKIAVPWLQPGVPSECESLWCCTGHAHIEAALHAIGET